MKDLVKRMESQAINWKKIFVNNYSIKDLVFRTYKEFSKPNSKKKLVRKWAKDMTIHVIEEDIQIANKQ